MLRRFPLVALLAVSGAFAQSDVEPSQPQSMDRSPTLRYAGDGYRLGIGIDTEFDVVGEARITIHETWRSAFLGEGWLGNHGAAGLKFNYHRVLGGQADDGPDGPVLTDGHVAKLFVAADQNRHDDRKLTLGGGWERDRWFASLYGMRALTSERLVNRAVELSDRLVTGTLDGHDFTRVDTVESITEWFEEPYDWGLGVRVGRHFEQSLMRLRGGLDYEDGDFGSSQTTASLMLEKFFAGTPHSLTLRTGYARKKGDFVDDRNDLRAGLIYSYAFGRRFQPETSWREETVRVADPQPRVEERSVMTAITLSDTATFALDRSELRPAARETLDELLAALEMGRLVGTVEVEGHTCDLGTDAYNQGLSERRAESVVDYLVAGGLDPESIVSRGMGEAQPRYPNDSEANRSRNRRVEIRFSTERPVTEQVTVTPDGPVTEVRQVEVPVEAPWIRRALRNPVAHKREVDTYRYAETSEIVTEGDPVFDNQPPAAADDLFEVAIDSSDNPLDVLANDSDPDGDALEIVEVSSPANGQAAVQGGSVSYTPAPGFSGTDTFQYTIDDGFGGQSSATVTVLVQEPNQPPQATDLNVTTQRAQAVTVDVLAAASDPDGDPLEILEFTQPANGQVTRSGDLLEYTPEREFTGADSFQWTVGDGRGGMATATVNVTVVFANRPPVARPDFATGPAGQPIVVDVLANDFDPDGDPLEVVDVQRISTAPAEITINPDQTVTFVISGTCSGENIFRYTISDPFGATASATVNIPREDSGNTPDCLVPGLD